LAHRQCSPSCARLRPRGILSGMTTDSPKPRRRWLQFSLRTLFVVVTVFCVWMGITANRARDQRLAVEAIEALGGTIRYEYQGDYDYVVITNTGVQTGRSPVPPGPEWLRGLIGDEFFFSVSKIELGGTKADDASLTAIGRLADMKNLNLRYNQVTDAGLEHLIGLTNLESLTLDGTQITDAGLVHLQRLTNLLMLNLCETQITDAGLEHLKAMTNLKTLWLDYTQVTNEGVAKLQQALPNCNIVHIIH